MKEDKFVSGKIVQISATDCDEVWGLDEDGNLYYLAFDRDKMKSYWVLSIPNNQERNLEVLERKD